MRTAGARLSVAGLLTALFGAGAFLWYRGRLTANEAAAVRALYLLVEVERDWRLNDRDGNNINDFWTADVAGLRNWDPMTYEVEGSGPSGNTVDRIDAALADADAAPVFPGAPEPRFHCGYSFVALERDLSVTPPLPYKGDCFRKPRRPIPSRNLNHFERFGFCAFPGHSEKTGRWTFIVNERGNVYRIANGGMRILDWPTDEDLKSRWEEMPAPRSGNW